MGTGDVRKVVDEDEECSWKDRVLENTAFRLHDLETSPFNMAFIKQFVNNTISKYSTRDAAGLEPVKKASLPNGMSNNHSGFVTYHTEMV